MHAPAKKTVRRTADELIDAVQKLDKLVNMPLKCLFCGEPIVWGEIMTAPYCHCEGIVCDTNGCKARFDRTRVGCDTCRLKRPTSCLMCGEDYGAYGRKATDYLPQQAKCGCEGYGADCASIDGKVVPTLVDARTCGQGLDKDCYKCRQKK